MTTQQHTDPMQQLNALAAAGQRGPAPQMPQPVAPTNAPVQSPAQPSDADVRQWAVDRNCFDNSNRLIKSPLSGRWCPPVVVATGHVRDEASGGFLPTWPMNVHTAHVLERACQEFERSPGDPKWQAPQQQTQPAPAPAPEAPRESAWTPPGAPVPPPAPGAANYAVNPPQQQAPQPPAPPYPQAAPPNTYPPPGSVAQNPALQYPTAPVAAPVNPPYPGQPAAPYVQPPAPEEQPKPKRGRPPGTKNKAKEEPSVPATPQSPNTVGHAVLPGAHGSPISQHAPQLAMATGDDSPRLTLLIDCIYSGDDDGHAPVCTDLSLYVPEANSMIAQQTGCADWRLIDYGKGGGALAIAIRLIVERALSGGSLYLSVDTRSAEWPHVSSTLREMADEIIMSTRGG